MRAAALLPFLLYAASAQAFPWELRIEGEEDNLDHGQPGWKEVLAQLAWKPRKSLAVIGGYRETERFDQRDREVFGGAYVPLGSDRTTVHLEASSSSTHVVLPKSMLLAELSQAFGDGWVVTAGYKASRYATGDTEMALGAIEKYFGDYRIGYNLYLGRPEGASWAPSHRISASWYRGTLTFVTIAAARGREVENVFPAGLISTDVRSVLLAGGLEVSPQWGLTFAIGEERQGNLYTRRGARIGTRILF
jgi:YaiO family outer membrane protein